MKQYTIFFLGESINNLPLDTLKVNLAGLFKSDLARIDKLFTGKAVIIKKDLSLDKAKAYQQALIKAGAKIVIKESQASPVQPQKESTSQQLAPQESLPISDKKPLSTGLSSLINYNSAAVQENKKAVDSYDSKPVEAHDVLSLSPENSGSLEEFSPQVEAVDIPDISNLTMSDANQGSLEEFSHPVEVVDLPDIDQYSLSSANEGDLTQYSKKVVAVEIADISYMDITDMNDRYLSDQKTKSVPQEIPDISDLTMSAPNEGSLEEFSQVKDIQELPDISHLQTVD